MSGLSWVRCMPSPVLSLAIISASAERQGARFALTQVVVGKRFARSCMSNDLCRKFAGGMFMPQRRALMFTFRPINLSSSLVWLMGLLKSESGYRVATGCPGITGILRARSFLRWVGSHEWKPVHEGSDSVSNGVLTLLSNIIRGSHYNTIVNVHFTVIYQYMRIEFDLKKKTASERSQVSITLTRIVPEKGDNRELKLYCYY